MRPWKLRRREHKSTTSALRSRNMEGTLPHFASLSVPLTISAHENAIDCFWISMHCHWEIHYGQRRLTPATHMHLEFAAISQCRVEHASSRAIKQVHCHQRTHILSNWSHCSKYINNVFRFKVIGSLQPVVDISVWRSRETPGSPNRALSSWITNFQERLCWSGDEKGIGHRLSLSFLNELLIQCYCYWT